VSSRYAVKIYYEGKNYYGFQLQKGRRTVSGEIVVALTKSELINDCYTATFQAASRTDRGVSALGQTVAFTTSKIFTTPRLNAFLPDDIITWAWARTPSNFNPRREAEERRYVYVYPYQDEDLGLMHQASKLIREYTHARRKQFFRPIQTLRISRRGNHIFFNFSSKSFSRGMIRRLVGILLRVGKRDLKADAIKSLMEKDHDFKSAAQLAPAQNLMLLDVKYSFAFHVDEPAKEELLKRLRRVVGEAELKRLCVKKLSQEHIVL